MRKSILTIAVVALSLVAAMLAAQGVIIHRGGTPVAGVIIVDRGLKSPSPRSVA